jgi:cellulose synthase/poly-beta-1,6-N-acetylglucosamine synthase-like glycosyltransferase
LPIYNERFVINRLIEAVARFEYPHHLLEIQVLDDSDDVTSEIISQAVARWQASGINIEHIRRANRQGYKGGALQYGLTCAKGDFIAIFDADFQPSPDFLQSMIPYFADNPILGCLQARWGHLNRETSWLTRAQATGIDGHFIIEQATRSALGVFLNFNGSAGIWRRTCLEDVGGWHHDTLTEDLDMSYRAQLHGWRIRYLPHISAPAELPAHINAYKRQQFRWAKGSIQTALKHLAVLWKSSHPLAVKVEGTIHLTNYAVHPFILLNLFLTLPLMLNRSQFLWLIPSFTLAAIGPWLMYWIAMREQSLGYLERFSNLIVLVLLGVGLSLNNSRAVIEALIGKPSPFFRTPKFDLNGQAHNNQKKSIYLMQSDLWVWIDIILAIYATSLVIYAFANGLWNITPWLFIYIGGFSYVAGLSFIQSHQTIPHNSAYKMTSSKLHRHQRHEKTGSCQPQTKRVDKLA